MPNPNQPTGTTRSTLNISIGRVVSTIEQMHRTAPVVRDGQPFFGAEIPVRFSDHPINLRCMKKMIVAK